MKFKTLFLALLFTFTSGICVASPGGDIQQALTKGNHRFATGKAIHPNASRKRIPETFKNGQHPMATVLACSDSRVPVEMIFDQGIGDLFVVRVAGNVCSTDETGSIEYAVEHLHTPLVVVMGHTKCGAVTAVVHGERAHGDLRKLLSNIVPAVKKARKRNPGMDGEDLVDIAIKQNVRQAIHDLMKNSRVVAKHVKEGKTKVVGAVYHMDIGRVEWLEE